jgi:phosphoribosylamine--glycine ligase
MKVLVIGGGGREHAMVWKLNQSRQVDQVYCVPGNAGIASQAECVDIDPENFDALLDFVKYEWIDLTFVGPEAPLAAGIVDALEKEGRNIIGSSKAAAQLESSKQFAKDFMKRYGIPTAEYKTFSSYTQAEDYVRLKGTPIVVKADGLAAGKGVIIAETHEEAVKALHTIMKDRSFGSAGDRVVVEECLVGEEASYMAFCDGNVMLPMASSQDHKRVFENDRGPNTGGMGAYSPAPVVTSELEKKIMDRVMNPVLRGMKNEGVTFKGILYAGIMIRDGEPYVLEFNCRLGDPEAQPILMRLETDLVDVATAMVEGRLSEVELAWKPEASVCVVLASGGYPGSYEKGKPITGLQETSEEDDVVVFHAGTAFDDGNVVTSGGRVLGVTALGPDIRAARERAHGAIENIRFEGMHYRRDIGDRALRRLA